MTAFVKGRKVWGSPHFLPEMSLKQFVQGQSLSSPSSCPVLLRQQATRVLQPHETLESSTNIRQKRTGPCMLRQHRQVGGQVSQHQKASKHESPTAGTQQGAVSDLSHLIVGFSSAA